MIDKIQYDILINEENVLETIAVSKSAFFSAESERKVSYMEFLFLQSKLIQKRWWVLQGLLLIAVCLLFFRMETDYQIRRALGLAGPLFVLLVLPELWKNRNFDAMEVECTTYYTIRSIYAARLTIFACVDILLLSVFFVCTILLIKITLWEILIQFVLPFNVTCCICFRSLYAKRIRSEALAMLLCILGTAVWAMLVLSNAVYSVISVPIWIVALILSFFGVGYTLWHGQDEWQKIWEVNALWI